MIPCQKDPWKHITTPYVLFGPIAPATAEIFYNTHDTPMLLIFLAMMHDLSKTTTNL
jgi:hypothetical protein